MRKFKNLFNVCVLSLSLLTFSQDLVLGLMHLVDGFGNTTGVPVIEQIDFLNEVWYQLEDLK